MNDNPEGTPNPLNPNPAPVSPEAAPTGVTPATPATPAEPVAPAPAPAPQPAPAAAEIPVNRPAVGEPVVQPTMAAQPVPPVAPVEPVAGQPSVEPQNTEPQAAEPAKKKKTSLIVTLIIFFVVLIGAAVAALIVYSPAGWFVGSDDRVPTAIAKLFSDGAPTNVKMSGSISLTSSDENSAVSTVDVTFISEQNNVSLANSANASVTLTFADESELTFEVDEVRTEGGDLYLRLDDLATALEEYNQTSTEAADTGEEIAETNCLTDESGETNCAEEVTTVMPLADMIGVFQIIDNQWIRISGNDFSALTDVADIDAPAQCLIDAAGSLSDYDVDFASAYNNNKFIEYTTENLTVAKKKDNLYLLSINPTNFAGFINSVPSGFMNSLYACVGGTASNGTISAAEAEKFAEMIPAIYVEIDENDMFTRVYLKANNSDNSASVIADISLTYPEKITITEPSEYIDLNALLSQLFSGLFGEEIVEVTE